MQLEIFDSRKNSQVERLLFDGNEVHPVKVNAKTALETQRYMQDLIDGKPQKVQKVGVVKSLLGWIKSETAKKK